jgi:hypothetical protein
MNEKRNTMKKFILLYKGPPTASDASHEGSPAWFDKIRDQLGRVFGARATLLIGGSPLGLATGGILLSFVPSTSAFGFSLYPGWFRLTCLPNLPRFVASLCKR